MRGRPLRNATARMLSSSMSGSFPSLLQLVTLNVAAVLEHASTNLRRFEDHAVDDCYIIDHNIDAGSDLQDV